jgi:uncharacterized protein (DUF952 family)
MDVLLHLVTADEWDGAQAAGGIEPGPAGSGEFVHLSAPHQVHLPANRLFAGRDDVLLLVLDPDRLGAEVRWEPGVPGDPASMTFPHLYGALPVAAVVRVVPYTLGPDGDFPVVDPADVAGATPPEPDRSTEDR